MEKENATEIDVLQDLFGAKCVAESPSPRKRKGKNTGENSDVTPPKRMPLAPSKFNIDVSQERRYDQKSKKVARKALFGNEITNVVEGSNISVTTPKKVSIISSRNVFMSSFILFITIF